MLTSACLKVSFKGGSTEILSFIDYDFSTLLDENPESTLEDFITLAFLQELFPTDHSALPDLPFVEVDYPENIRFIGTGNNHNSYPNHPQGSVSFVGFTEELVKEYIKRYYDYELDLVNAINNTHLTGIQTVLDDLGYRDFHIIPEPTVTSFQRCTSEELSSVGGGEAPVTDAFDSVRGCLSNLVGVLESDGFEVAKYSQSPDEIIFKSDCSIAEGEVPPIPNKTLLFGTYNGYLHKDGELETIITFSKSSKDWVLKEGETVLANAEGYVSPSISLSNSTDVPDCWDLTLSRPVRRNHEFSLGGNIDFVKITTDPNKKLAGGTGTLFVRELSKYIDRYIINAGDCHLSGDYEILPHITNAESMFEGCRHHNGSVGHLDLSNIVNMKNMFKGNIRLNNGTSWNNPPEYVDCSSAENMDGMFDGCSIFAQDLSTWCVPKITSKPVNFDRGSKMLKTPVWGTCPSRTEE